MNQTAAADYCVTKAYMEKMKDSINNVIDSITLKDMVNEYYRIEAARKGERTNGQE